MSRPRPTSFAEFCATPATGPTYTDLARENARLLEQVQELQAKLTKTSEALRRRWDTHGYVRQQAFLELAHDLAEMEPEARERALRRIIDDAQ